MAYGILFNRKITKAVLIALAMLSGFVLIAFQINFVLLVFAGIFTSVVLTYASSWVSGKLRIKYGLSLLIVLLLLSGSIVGLVLLIGPSIVEQSSEMIDTLPKSLASLKEKVSQTTIGENILKRIPENPENLVEDKGEAVSNVAAVLSAVTGAFANFVIIIITGIYLASDPETYTKGFKSLFPVAFRSRLGEVMDKTYHTLSLWMMAKLISMLVVGVASAVGLLLLGIPLAFALAFIAALFSFIPNIGPILAIVPAALIAFTEGSDKALYVVLLYFGIQLVESYLITPLVEKKMIALPPALSLFWMVIWGLLAGVFGLVMATPILAVIIVIVGELYVKDYVEAQSDSLPSRDTREQVAQLVEN